MSEQVQQVESGSLDLWWGDLRGVSRVFCYQLPLQNYHAAQRIRLGHFVTDTKPSPISTIDCMANELTDRVHCSKSLS